MDQRSNYLSQINGSTQGPKEFSQFLAHFNKLKAADKSHLFKSEFQQIPFEGKPVQKKDPSRVTRILKKIKCLWNHTPDLDLLKILTRIVNDSPNLNESKSDQDLEKSLDSALSAIKTRKENLKAWDSVLEAFPVNVHDEIQITTKLKKNNEVLKFLIDNSPFADVPLTPKKKSGEKW